MIKCTPSGNVCICKNHIYLVPFYLNRSILLALREEHRPQVAREDPAIIAVVKPAAIKPGPVVAKKADTKKVQKKEVETGRKEDIKENGLVGEAEDPRLMSSRIIRAREVDAAAGTREEQIMRSLFVQELILGGLMSGDD